RLSAALQKMVKNRPVIIYDSIPWNVELKQRPQHLALQLSLADYFIVYLERNGVDMLKKITPNLVTTNSTNILGSLAPNKDVYILVSSTNAYSEVYKNIQKSLNGKAKIIYEYIDDIHEDISPNVYELQRFYDSLKK